MFSGVGMHPYGGFTLRQAGLKGKVNGNGSTPVRGHAWNQWDPTVPGPLLLKQQVKEQRSSEHNSEQGDHRQPHLQVMKRLLDAPDVPAERLKPLGPLHETHCIAWAKVALSRLHNHVSPHLRSTSLCAFWQTRDHCSNPHSLHCI